jgi:hypothetical protein
VMAGEDPVHRQECDAEENNFARRPAHGPCGRQRPTLAAAIGRCAILSSTDTSPRSASRARAHVMAIRESSHSSKESDAINLLKLREGVVDGSRRSPPPT